MTNAIPLDEISDAVRRGVLSIGNFDGVHRGHAALIGQARTMADAIGGPVVAVVLDPHPAAILRPEQAPAKLMWIERRAELLVRAGADFVVVIPTDYAFFQQTATEFFDLLVCGRMEARGIVEGPNFFFGRNREGDIKTLAALCQKNGIQLSVAKPSRDAHSMVSSTRIRDLLTAAQVDHARELLGRPHRIRGSVVHGAARGKRMGFPTANLSGMDVLVPALGVYGGYAVVDQRHYVAAIHIGSNPTFNDCTERKVEIHLLDYAGDLYNSHLMVDFVTRVRDIARFDSPEQLIGQLNRDIDSIRRVLVNHPLHLN